MASSPVGSLQSARLGVNRLIPGIAPAFIAMPRRVWQPTPRTHQASRVVVPAAFEPPMSETMSTQAGFGRLLADIARTHPELADRLVTTSPDVTVSTNLGGWVNRRAIFDTRDRSDTFRDERIVSAQNWTMSPQGQHIELGIAESNLFLLLAALGLSAPLFGARLLPIGTDGIRARVRR